MSRAAVAARLRSARAGDAERIGAVARAAYDQYVPRIGRAPAPMVADFAAEIAAGRVVVIEAAGAIAGYMIAWPQPDGYFIDNIAVDPVWQGCRSGRRLIDHGEREARRHALAAIRLYTKAAMTEHISLYARLGFVEAHRAVEQGSSRAFMRRALSATGHPS